MPSNFQCSKCIQGNEKSFQQQMIRQVQTRLWMVEVSCIIILIPQSQDKITVYCSMLEKSVVYCHIVTTMKLYKAYQ